MNNPDALPDLTPDNNKGFSVPTPPNADMGMRTMSSDASSLRSPGGMSTEPKAFNPKDLLSNEPAFNPAGNNPNDEFSLPPEPPHKNRGLIIGLGIAGILIILGVVGYFILRPLIQKTFFAPAPPVAPAPEPVVIPQPVPPPAEPQPVPPPPAFQHSSLFPGASAVSAVNINLPVLNVESINNGIKQAFGPTVAVPAFNETVFMFSGGVVDAYQFLGTLIPSLSTLTSAISQDFTGFVYKDKDGVWPGYVFTLQNGNAATEPTLGLVNAVQSSAAAFYTSDPGAQKSDFREGAKLSANFVWVKYKPYTIPGASFNVGQVAINGKNYLIVSTSFQGIKMAVQKLGF